MSPTSSSAVWSRPTTLVRLAAATAAPGPSCSSPTDVAFLRRFLPQSGDAVRRMQGVRLRPFRWARGSARPVQPQVRNHRSLPWLGADRHPATCRYVLAPSKRNNKESRLRIPPDNLAVAPQITRSSRPQRAQPLSKGSSAFSTSLASRSSCKVSNRL